MATKYEGLTSAQWANRIVDYNPGKFLKSALVAHENGIKINFDACPGGVCRKKPGPKPGPKKKPDDDLYSDDSDLESCDEDD